METSRLPKGHVYTGRGEVVDMDNIVAQAQKTVREKTAEVSRIQVPREQAQTKLRGNVVGAAQPETPTVYSANTPEGLEPTLAELTGVRIDRMKHIKVVREPTPEEVDQLVELNAGSVLGQMKALEPAAKKERPELDDSQTTTRRRRKSEAEKLADEI